MQPPEDLIDFDQIRLCVRDMDVRVFESTVTTGPAFVLIHGFGVSSRYFGPLAKELSQYGRVLVFDLPGFGKTDDPDHALRITGFAHVVNETIRRLEVKDPILIGHSMGTQIAVEALTRAPGLSSGAVLAAPVVNDRERRGGLLLWRFAQSAVKETTSSALASVIGFLHSGPRWLIRDFGPMRNYRIEEHLSEIDVPLTIVGATGDRIAPPDWLQDPRLALLAVCLITVWSSLGLNVVIFMAGLQNIPESVMEAAQIDGAGVARRFLNITVPMLSPIIFFQSVVAFISSLQTFDLVFVLVKNAGPDNATRTIVYHIYDLGFAKSQFGISSVASIILLALTLVITAVQFGLQKRFVHYEG